MDTLSSQEKRDLTKFVKFLCLKSTQVIVQGRLGKRILTNSVSSSSGAEWFNLAIKDYPEIQKEAKLAIHEGVPNFDKSLVIEISLRTSDAESMLVEVWSIGITNKYEDVKVHHTVYNRMSMLLKSLLCVSRITPAYKLSRRQGADYVICYRVYMGKIELKGLGEGYKTLRVGSVGTPIGTITMASAYRTAERLHLSTKALSPQPFQMNFDHFSQQQQRPPLTTSPARPCHTLKSRLRTLSQTSEATSPSFNVFKASMSNSPDKILQKGRGLVKFTVGTPPSGRLSATPPSNNLSSSKSSPILAPTRKNRNELCKPLSYQLNENEPEKCLRKGTSVPIINKNGKKEDHEIVQNSPPTNNCHSETMYCHWNASNTKTIVAEKSNQPCAKKQDLIKHSHKGLQNLHKINTQGGFSLGLESVLSSPPLITGAFVTGCKTAKKVKEGLIFGETSALPFSDLLNNVNKSNKTVEEDALSESDTSQDELKKESSDCSSSYSSKQSEKEIFSPAFNKLNSDFVMINLNPAFANDESGFDLGTFYRECENVPELVMFDERRASENEETLLDLAKQLEDYESEMKSFDLFVEQLGS